MSRVTASWVLAGVKQPDISVGTRAGSHHSVSRFCQPSYQPNLPAVRLCSGVLLWENVSLFSPGRKTLQMSDGHLACERRGGGGGERKGRKKSTVEFMRRVRNRWGWAASQQLFPVFISLFQPLAFWWDVRGGAFVCMGCGGCGEIIPLVSGQVIKLSLPSYRGIVEQLMVRDWYFYTHQTTNSTQ